MMRALVVAVSCLLSLPAAADPYYPQPPGHKELLARRPDLAFTGWESWPINMDLLRRVNDQVNASMTYRPEEEDLWGLGSDCEDYAVVKLERLLAAGVPRGALQLAIAQLEGRGHAVLVVRGYWILDSLHDEVLPRDQSTAKLEAWETVGGRWNPAGAFGSLADHLLLLRQSKAEQQDRLPEVTHVSLRQRPISAGLRDDRHEPLGAH